jgi:hypothetical protein
MAVEHGIVLKFRSYCIKDLISIVVTMTVSKRGRYNFHHSVTLVA